jgi:hypothetical protein
MEYGLEEAKELELSVRIRELVEQALGEMPGSSTVHIVHNPKKPEKKYLRLWSAEFESKEDGGLIRLLRWLTLRRIRISEDGNGVMVLLELHSFEVQPSGSARGPPEAPDRGRKGFNESDASSHNKASNKGLSLSNPYKRPIKDYKPLPRREGYYASKTGLYIKKAPESNGSRITLRPGQSGFGGRISGLEFMRMQREGLIIDDKEAAKQAQDAEEEEEPWEDDDDDPSGLPEPPTRPLPPPYPKKPELKKLPDDDGDWPDEPEDEEEDETKEGSE